MICDRAIKVKGKLALSTKEC